MVVWPLALQANFFSNSQSFPEISHVEKGISKYISEQKLFTEINREREFSKSEGTNVKS